MDTSIVDFSFIYDMAEGDTIYIYEVIGLFLNTLENGLKDLDSMISSGADFDEIRKKAHFLKSSSNVIKVRGMRDAFVELEDMARESTGREKMPALITGLLATFKDARPVLEAEVAKNKPVKV